VVVKSVTSLFDDNFDDATDLMTSLMTSPVSAFSFDLLGSARTNGSSFVLEFIMMKALFFVVYTPFMTGLLTDVITNYVFFTAFSCQMSSYCLEYDNLVSDYLFRHVCFWKAQFLTEKDCLAVCSYESDNFP
jgi:hypothetical protein